MRLAQIGATANGGVCRLALTERDRDARNLFVGWAKEIGCTVRIDAIGNIFARRAGACDDLPPVMTGSHIDTQPTGGKFDGNYGVLAGLEVLRTLDDAACARAPLEVAVWTNEEGSRFVPVMMGSGVFARAFTLEHASRNAIATASPCAMRSQRSAMGDVRDAHPVGAYFEAHIEQGPVLEAHATTIGVVEARSGSAGTTSPCTGWRRTPARRRWRCGATRCWWRPISCAVNGIALAHPPHGRGTVGWIDVHPNSRNVIPGRVTLTVDLRAADDATLAAMDAALRAACADLAATAGMPIDVEQVVYFAPSRSTRRSSNRCARARMRWACRR
jgi:N-carbamoyl-L-amino-acid hydrolase